MKKKFKVYYSNHDDSDAREKVISILTDELLTNFCLSPQQYEIYFGGLDYVEYEVTIKVKET